MAEEEAAETNEKREVQTPQQTAKHRVVVTAGQGQDLHKRPSSLF